MRCDDDESGAMRCTMFESEQLRKHALECLRLEADCMQLAGYASNPNSQSHFLRMARIWSTLAVSRPSANAGRQFCRSKS
jgi:hypothetical protein